MTKIQHDVNPPTLVLSETVLREAMNAYSAGRAALAQYEDRKVSTPNTADYWMLCMRFPWASSGAWVISAEAMRESVMDATSGGLRSRLWRNLFKPERKEPALVLGPRSWLSTDESLVDFLDNVARLDLTTTPAIVSFGTCVDDQGLLEDLAISYILISSLDKSVNSKLAPGAYSDLASLIASKSRMNNIQLERLGRLMRSMGDEACAVMISDAAEEAKSTCGIRDLAYSARHGNAARLALLAKVEQMALARGQHIAVGELVPADAYVSQASVETRRFDANAATVKELSPVSQSVDQQQAEVMTSKAQPPIDPGCPAARRVPLSVGDRAQALFIADVHVPMTPALRAEIMDITGEMASGAGLGVTTVPPDGDARAFADVEARNVSASLFVRWDEQALAVRIEWASVNLPGTESIEIVHNGAENRLRLARFHCAPPRTMVYADTAPPEWAQKLIGRIGAIRKAEGISDQLRIASADATWTVRCIANPARTRTVVVACEAKLAEFIASPLAALVDWVEITPETSIELQHRHGHAAAVPVAAIRMFQPGWQASDSAARHPWMLSDSHISDVWSVLFARDATPMAEATRVTIMQRAIDKLAALDASETRAARAEHDRSAATASAARATTDLEAALDVAAGHRREYESADAERRQMRGQIIALEQKIGAMVHHAVDLETRLTSVRPSMESWDDIQHWVVESLTSRLVLTPKALSAARSSVYRDFTFVANVLELLAGDYRSMRIGVAGARERYECVRCTFSAIQNARIPPPSMLRYHHQKCWSPPPETPSGRG